MIEDITKKLNDLGKDIGARMYEAMDKINNKLGSQLDKEEPAEKTEEQIKRDNASKFLDLKLNEINRLKLYTASVATGHEDAAAYLVEAYNIIAKIDHDYKNSDWLNDFCPDEVHCIICSLKQDLAELVCGYSDKKKKKALYEIFNILEDLERYTRHELQGI